MIEKNFCARAGGKRKVEIIRTIVLPTRSFDEKIKRLNRKTLGVRRIDKIKVRRKMRHADHESSAGHENPMEIAKDRNILDMLEHILAENLLKMIVRKRQREFFDIMHDIYARKRADIEVNISGENMLPTAEVEFLA